MSGRSGQTSNGQVVFDQLTVGDYQLEITHDEYQTRSDSFSLSGDTTRNYSLEPVDGEANLYRLTIQILDENGDPMSGVSATIGGVSDTSGSDGTVEFELSPGDYTLTLSASGYQTQTTTLTVSDTGTTDSVSMDPVETQGVLGGTVTLSTDATVGSGESLELSVGVDEGNNGSIDQTQTIDVPDGENEVELEDWPSAEGDRYLWTVTATAQTAEQSPQLHNVEIATSGLEPIGAVYAPVELDGMQYTFEVPVFHPDTLDDSRLRTPLPDGREGALYLVDAGQSPLECRTPDDVRHGVYIGENTTGMPLPSSEGATTEFTLADEREGINFTELVSSYTSATGSSSTPEGLAYHDGNLYTGERDEPATIREWDLNGTPTGAAFELPDSAGHCNTIAWFDGELWVSSSSERRTYILDWDGSNTTVVGTIDHDDPVSTSAWRVIVTGTMGPARLLFPQYRGEDAWVIDAEGARADGTTAGNVLQVLDTGYWHNPQTTHWSGDSSDPAYTTTHEHVIKHEIEDVDALTNTDELYGGSVEWVHPLPHEVRVEQLTHNPATGEFYALGRGGEGRILVGEETVTTYDNGDFGTWDTTAVSNHPEASYARHVDTSSTEYVRFNYTPTYGRVGVWFYDDLAADKRVYPAVEDDNGDATNIGVATHQGFGDATYGFWDGSWHDTGIARQEGWIKFAWVTNPDGAIRAYISTNGGHSWKDAGTSVRDETAFRGVRIQRYAGEAFVGPWDVDVWREIDSDSSTTSLAWGEGAYGLGPFGVGSYD